MISGSTNRSKNYISRHGNDHIDLVLLAGTNDLANRKTSPEELIEELDKQITELKGFNNLGHIFLCKIPYRFDFHVVNSKVVKFNELLHERFSDTEEFITVINTIPPEFKFYYDKMACILVMSDYPNFVAYCYLAYIEFLLLPNLPDEDARELVVHSAMMAPVR